MRFKRLLKVCLTMSFCAACTACAPKVQVREIPMEPPASLLTECPQPPKPEGMTDGTLRDYAVASTLYIIDVERELANCNGDKAALREWYRTTREVKRD